jgi:hypothetical protein
MKVSSSGIKLGCAIVSSSFVAAVTIALSGASAIAAQFITIQSTGTLSGTIELPRNNPNFNNSTTRIDTDETGTYYRNLGTNNNPNYVPVYQSDYLQVETRSDGSLHYFVDFKGIPFVSFDGVLTSPVLASGQLTPYKYQGQLDEFNFIKAFYTGTVTDPDTGKQYQGTFEVNGYGERYSDRNGSLTPTVFDFQSDIPGSPSVTSLTITNATLANLRIKVPINETSIPEPASLIGTLMVAGFGIVLKRRKYVCAKKMF